MAADQQRPSKRTESAGPVGGLRWQGLFQRCQEPLFVLNRRRSLLFVNRAWEALTNISLADARGLVCRRRREPQLDSPDILQHALAPPPEALAGTPVRVRRLLPGGTAAPRWWDVTFFPLTGPQGLLAILGRISAVTPEGPLAYTVLPERLVALRERHRQCYGLENLASELPALRRVAEQVRLARQTQSPLLLLGEPGTGKQWVARTIHQEGPSREQGFATLDCGRLPAAALAAVLFGPARLTRWAGVGTLYLKDPARLPRELQARLLDLLDANERSVPEGAAELGPRILAGCNSDPAEEVRAGRLVAELHYALSPLTITLPPLRERLADLPTLVERMLGRLNADGDRQVTALTAEAWDVVRTFRWPGNLRELHAVLAEARGRAKAERIEPGDLPLYLRSPAATPERPLPLDTLLEQVERSLIVLALRKARNNKTRAAEILSIWRPRLSRRMEALGIGDQEEGDTKD
jgi:transcriptional regulator with AAA-type ATPase domain